MFQVEVISKSDKEGHYKPVTMRVDVNYDALMMLVTSLYLWIFGLKVLKFVAGAKKWQ